MSDTVRSVAIIGAGLAGANVAAGLRSHGYAGHVTLVGSESHLPYERPPLTKDVLAGVMAVDQTAVHPAEFYQDNEIELVLGEPVDALDLSERSVVLARGRRLRADRVVLCTGVSPRRLGVPGEDLEGVHSVRDREDSQALRNAAERGDPIVVIGEGFIGTEVASTLARQGCDVTVLMGRDLPVQPVLGADAGAWLAQQHRVNGVRLRPSTPPRAIIGTSSVQGVELADGSVVPASAVVVGIGSIPSGQSLASDAGITTRDGVVVDGVGRSSVPEVFATGDLARFPTSSYGEIRVEHWQHAIQHAQVVAAAIVGVEQAPYAGVPWVWTEQFGRRWEIAGLPQRGTDVVRRGDPDSDEGALWAFTNDSRVVAAVALGRRRELRAVLRSLEGPVSLMTPQFVDESVDVRRALVAEAW